MSAIPFIPYENISCIYQIVNTVNQKRYVGATMRMKRRSWEHTSNLQKGRHINQHLQNAWNKYGRHAFSFEILEVCDKSVLSKREDYWCKILKCNDVEFGYNVKTTDPTSDHKTHTSQTKEKLSKMFMGVKKSYVTKGHPLSEQHKIKMQEGVRNSPIFKKAHRQKRGRRVIDTVTGIIYLSLSEVVEITGMCKVSLGGRLRGTIKNNTSYRYI